MSKRKPPRQKYRRLVGPVELPKSDADFLADAQRQLRSAQRHGQAITGQSHSTDLPHHRPSGASRRAAQEERQ